MADKSAQILERLQFHPCDVPRGMEPYDLQCLTRLQQLRLNNHKIEVIRENQAYLYKTPEIRAVVQIIIRKLLLDRPSHDIQKFIGQYFRNHSNTILEEINEYVDKYPRKPSPIDLKKKVITKEDKRVTMEDVMSDEGSTRDDELIFSINYDNAVGTRIVKDILDEIVDNIGSEQEYSPKRIRRTLVEEETLEDNSLDKSDKSIDDEELFFDFGLDFDLDFSGYHEEDDPTSVQGLEASDQKINNLGRIGK
ncbi:uncharacterized protein LOC126740855 [Anthonomus grandis grandis]|uniref:uncharacterized protein LOC126740855 n=1 Tax=Anthonomus grandis grandis TaxID=2921223 RepID=UPI0021663E8F|nr:uncharacterized protein LOC126740855 [Anthonomus grandis grandis]